ncbi:MAG: 50S ribosomal protein L7/L12 [Sphaerochaetaceae bacterium]|jgi:large subunit ribosomal protein L7/L12|nr:50S ribosomal protein L7/L12 [Sphaerochaetaceae bacterium]
MVSKEEILEAIANMTVLEVSELIKAMEVKFGVTAAAAVAAGGPVAAAAPAEEVEEQTEFDVLITGFDATKKIAGIKEVRACTDLGLKEAKDLVEGGGKVKEGISKADAAAIKEKLEAAGLTVQVK